MPKLSGAVRAYADAGYSVWTALTSVAAPNTLPPANPGIGWYDVGLLSDAGITEGHTYNENKAYDLSGGLLRIVRNQEERPWTFECVQDDAVTSGLMYPGATVSTTGATAEVQTITIGGAPTGGTTGPIRLAGYPDAPAQTYNVTTAALQAALRLAWNLAVTVTGTAGTSYVVTFPAGLGNAPLIAFPAPALTGGAGTITAVETTPGVQGVNTRNVGTGIGANIRQFAIDLKDGNLVKRVLMANAEAVWTGTVTYGSNIKISQFSLQPYKDSNGNFYTILDNDPAIGGTSFA
jgi:hypothetical protein